MSDIPDDEYLRYLQNQEDYNIHYDEFAYDQSDSSILIDGSNFSHPGEIPSFRSDKRLRTSTPSGFSPPEKRVDSSLSGFAADNLPPENDVSLSSELLDAPESDDFEPAAVTLTAPVEIPAGDPPIFAKRALSFKDIENVLLIRRNAVQLPAASIGHITPSGRAAKLLRGVTYIVQTASLRMASDIRADSLGKYTSNSTVSRFYKREDGGSYRRIDKSNAEPPDWDRRIMCTYRKNISSGKFHEFSLKNQ